MARSLRASTLIGILILVVWGCVLSAGVVIYARYSDPRQLALLIGQRLAAETDLAWNIDRASVGFFPGPHARLRTVTMRHPDARLDVSEVTIFMGWSSLLSLRFVPGRVVLESPVLAVSRPLLPVLSDAPDQAGAFARLPEAWRDTRLIVRHGSMAINDDAFGAVVRDLDASARLPGLLAGSLDLQGTLALPGIGDHLELRLLLDASAKNGDASPLSGRLEVRGDLAAAMPVPLRLSLPFALTSGREVRLPGVRIELDADAATPDAVTPDAVTIDAVLTPGEGLGPFDAFLGAFLDAFAREPSPAPRGSKPSRTDLPSVRGTARIHRLSLPRWFAFARSLPPGIEAALDDLSGEADFTLTPQSLTASRLQAVVRGIPFAGSGGVDDFDKPVIRITAHTDTADVNTIFPELLRQAPKAADWPGPPLFSRDAQGGGPDYDIRLTAAHAAVWKFTTTRFAFRCTPLPGGSRLGIEAGGLYGGSLVSTVDIEDRVTVEASLNQVTLDTPAALIAGESVLGGRLTGKAALSGSDASFDHFLASLDGTVQGHIAQGWLAKPGDKEKKEKNAFAAMDFTFKAAGAGLTGASLPPLLPFSGNWNVSLRTETWEGSCSLHGVLDLDSATLAVRRARAVPGRLHWKGGGLAVNLEALFDFDRKSDTLRIRNAAGKMNGGTIAGSLSGSGLSASSPEFPHPLWQGTVRFATADLRSILRQRGLDLPDMSDSALRYLDLRGDFTLSGSRIQARNLGGRLDDTTFSGSILHDPDDTHAWQADLALGAFTLSRYLPQGRSGAVSWPPKALDSLSARGVVSFESLLIAKLVQRSVRIPFVLKNRVLSCEPISFVPYTGRGEAALRLEASPEGCRTRLRYAASAMDAALLSREAGFTTILGGDAALSADVTGLLRQGADVPSALDGVWSVAVADGFITENRSGNARPGSVPFRSIRASGDMRQGILHTRDISLKGRELAASGTASINLVDWTLNCRLNVSTRTFSNVPVEYTGSLDAPERSINALHAVAGAIGKLGSGLFGLVEDVLSSPFRLLRRTISP